MDLGGGAGLSAKKYGPQQVLIPDAETIRKSYRDMVKYA